MCIVGPITRRLGTTAARILRDITYLETVRTSVYSAVPTHLPWATTAARVRLGNTHSLTRTSAVVACREHRAGRELAVRRSLGARTYRRTHHTTNVLRKSGAPAQPSG